MTVKTNNEISTGQNLCERKAMSSSDISHNLPTNHLVYIDGYFDIVNDEGLRKYTSESSLDDILADENLSHDEDGEHLTAIKKTNLARERHIITRQLALGSLMNVIDSLKVQTRSHFQEIIACLGHELHRGNVDETLELEQQELLWKSYERFFCQEVYRNLMELYVTGLTPAIQKAYITLQKMSLHEILKEDKLLNLFFGDTQMDRQSLSIPVLSHSQSEDKFSMSRTLSSLSLDVRSCDIKELYTLANADCNDLRKRFNLDLIEYDDNDNTPSSGSLKSSELSNEDETFDMNSESLSTSAKSAMSGASIEKEVDSDTDKWKAPSDTERVEEIFKRILSPYKKLINRCLNAASLLDKVRYITKATEGLNNDISQMIGPDFHSACDDIISMLILALYNLPQDMFIGLYINLRLLMDLFPGFLSGTLWDFNLVTLCASYDYLFTLKVCDLVVRQYPGSFKIKR